MSEKIENVVVDEVVEDAAEEVMNEGIKLDWKDIGIVCGSVALGLAALYGGYRLVKHLTTPKDVIDVKPNKKGFKFKNPFAKKTAEETNEKIEDEEENLVH